MVISSYSSSIRTVINRYLSLTIDSLLNIIHIICIAQPSLITGVAESDLAKLEIAENVAKNIIKYKKMLENVSKNNNNNNNISENSEEERVDVLFKQLNRHAKIEVEEIHNNSSKKIFEMKKRPFNKQDLIQVIDICIYS